METMEETITRINTSNQVIIHLASFGQDIPFARELLLRFRGWSPVGDTYIHTPGHRELEAALAPDSNLNALVLHVNGRYVNTHLVPHRHAVSKKKLLIIACEEDRHLVPKAVIDRYNIRFFPIISGCLLTLPAFLEEQLVLAQQPSLRR